MTQERRENGRTPVTGGFLEKKKKIPGETLVNEDLDQGQIFGYFCESNDWKKKSLFCRNPHADHTLLSSPF